MKEPDFSSPEFQSAVEAKLDEVVGRHALHVLHWIIAAIIGSLVTIVGAAVWATKLYVKIDQLSDSQVRMEQATQKRIDEWAMWRSDVDTKLRFLDSRGLDRWTRTNQREYNSQILLLNPALKAPDVDTIAGRQQP